VTSVLIYGGAVLAFVVCILSLIHQERRYRQRLRRRPVTPPGERKLPE